MKGTLLGLFFALTSTLYGGLAIAQEILQKPALEPGAVFHYQAVDHLKGNATTNTMVQTVLSVSDDRAKLEEVSSWKGRRTVTLDTAHQFLLGNGNTGDFEYMRFPIRVGDSWKFSFTAPDDGVPVIRNLSARFVGWEEVKVPAGTYKAAKIEHSGNWQRSDGPYSGSLELVFWYSPEIGRFVKQTYTWGGSRGGINANFTIELTKYQPAPDPSNPFSSPVPVK